MMIAVTDGATEIGERAYSGSALERAVIPDGILRIGDYAFSKCLRLTEVTIPESVVEIGCGAFSGCAALRSVVLPESVSRIGSYAFQNCALLERIVVPSSVSVFGDSIFAGCASLRDVTVPRSFRQIDFHDAQQYPRIERVSFTKCALPKSETFFQFNVYVPLTHLAQVKEAIGNAGAGRLGAYDNCMWCTAGSGQFRPLDGAHPYIGACGEVERVEEAKIECICSAECMPAVIAAMRSAHPYEVPAFQYWEVKIQ